jgi:hypothetical protein
VAETPVSASSPPQGYVLNQLRLHGDTLQQCHEHGRSNFRSTAKVLAAGWKIVDPGRARYTVISLTLL